jgi:hypothetical protein
MFFLVKDAIHTELVSSIYGEVFSRRSNYYYFVGKVIPWENPSVPDQPLETQQYEYDTRNRIIAVKKVQPGDVSFVIRRIDWVNGTVYDQFDGNYSSTFTSSTGATSLKEANFYVLTTDFNVYKCLFNKNGAPSTQQPTGTDPTTTITSDGYVWKYMFTLPLSLRNRFLTDILMPVRKSVFDPYYSNGSISDVVVTSRGSGYRGNALVSLTVNGSFGSGNGNVVANIVPVLNQAGSFVDIKIRNAGNNYVSANISINDLGGTGTGLYNTASTANLIPVIFNKKIDRILIVDPGVNYKSNIQTTLSLIGDGANASLLPFVNDVGELEDVIIVNEGEGYTFLDVEVVGSGTGANVIPQVSEGDLDSIQSTVELAAIPGAIYNIRIDNAGNNYSNANVLVSGDGVGFSGTVVISNSNTISHVVVTNPGSGYTYANVLFTGNGTGAQGSAILSPQNGHGFNAIKELFADTLVFYSTINNERIQGVDVNNDYRQFGLIKNIKQFGNQRNFANTTGTPCILVTANTVIDSTSALLKQDTILNLLTDSTRKFEVIETVASNTQILLNSINNYNLQVGDVLFEPNTASNFTVTVINNLPTINKFSGDLLFIDNRTKVSYSDQQLVTLKTILRL